MATITWLIVAAVFIIIEIVTLGLTTIWFAGGAILAAAVATFGAGWLTQVIVFGVTSLVLLIFTRPVVAKYFNSKRTKTNAESLVGEYCKVTEQIDNFNEKGVVLLNGLEWTARSKDDTVIPVGTRVKLVRIEGVKAIVEEEK